MAIAYARIFPSIGIARVGNSPEFFIGPESPGTVADNGGSYRDAEKRVKRQAARFRVYGFDDAGRVVGELTSADAASIRWEVQLANKKASWHAFDGTANVAVILRGDTSRPRRNAEVPDPARHRLDIGPPLSSIEGPGQQGAPMVGTFSYPIGPGAEQETEVVLGELHTDEAGRLLVLGGFGTSASVLDDNPLRHYANNDAWYDDVSDGPVHVKVTAKNGDPIEVRGGAWVVMAPPAFSPYTHNLVTLYDVLVEAALVHGLAWPVNELGPRPAADDRVSFTRDIYPILERLDGYQWISRRAQRGHAPGKNGYFLDPARLAVLSDPGQAGPSSPHRRIFDRIRTPVLSPPFEEQPSRPTALHRKSQAAIAQANLTFMPPLAGDEGDVLMGDPQYWFSVTERQYKQLLCWQNGDFDGDWTGSPPSRALETLPVQEQPHALIRAALEWGQGGAFFPGIELTSIVRFAEFYDEAFRVRGDGTGQPGEHEAGDLTKWMALPWQADFYECRDHWWPTARPDDVVAVGEYERIIEEFDEEREQGLATLLIARKPWARGVVGDLPSRPGLPAPAQESAAAYRERAIAQVQRFARSYLRFFAGAMRPLDGESTLAYRRRAEEFFGRTILDVPDFPFPPVDGPSDVYHAAVVRALRSYLAAKVAADVVPPPAAGETTAAYARRLAEEVAPAQRAWQGCFDIEWRIRAANRGKDFMVSRWNRLGFVAPPPNARERVLVEVDRDRFDLMNPRDAFHYMMNIEHHREFTDKAAELAREFLDQARGFLDVIPNLPSEEHYARFTYDELTFRARLEKIYETERRAGEAYDPSDAASEPLFRTPAHVVERIRQLAPFNQLDGSWLERVTKSGPIDDVASFLFEIWSDEIGNGNPAQNHANVYVDLMHSAGIYLPPISSRAYADHPDLWESSFVGPTYHAAIAHFPETFFPELLGMTLYLEWEAILLPAMVKLYRHHGYNPLFYTLHVAIDNPVLGHGARARDAVVRYLNDVRARAGEAQMQEHWQRIWDGYIAFRYIGGGEWEYRFTHPPTYDEQMLAMMERKRHYAQLNHNVRRLGVNSINDWFDEPDAFLEELANSDLVVKGDARRSKIFALLEQSGPMLKVFDAKDRELWAAWINSLPPDPVGVTDAATAMLRLVQQLSARAIGVPEHGTNLLAGTFIDPETGMPATVRKSVAWWLQLGNPVAFMEALRDPQNGLVVAGDPQHSRFVQELLLGGGRMSKFMTQTLPEIEDRPARDIVIEWITAGCPLPDADDPARRRVTAAGRRARVTGTEAPVLRIPARRVEEQAPRVIMRTLAAVQRTAVQYRGLQQRAYRWNGGSTH